MKPLRVDLITLFPNYFSSPFEESLIKKARDKNILNFNTVNLRDFAIDSHKTVDDTPYGGGAGMVLRADVLAKATSSVKTPSSLVILTDPAGKKFDQDLAFQLAGKEHLIIVCGRYEGVDQRFKDKYVDLEISVGDYVLNGGEAAALVILDAVSRLVPGVIGEKDSLSQESFSKFGNDLLLEYPQYTRPENFEGETVPEILLTGNHKKIEEWRIQKAKEKTSNLRPDLLTSKE